MNPATWLLIVALSGTPIPGVIETFVDRPEVPATPTDPAIPALSAQAACNERLQQVRLVAVTSVGRAYDCVSAEAHAAYVEVARKHMFEQYLKDEGLD